MDPIKSCYVLLKRLSNLEIDFISNPPDKKQKKNKDVTMINVSGSYLKSTAIVTPSFVSSNAHHPQPIFQIINPQDDNDKFYQVEISMPGISPEQLMLKTIGHEVNIDANIHTSNPFDCRINIPCEFDIEKLKYTFTEGRMFIIVPFICSNPPHPPQELNNLISIIDHKSNDNHWTKSFSKNVILADQSEMDDIKLEAEKARDSNNNNNGKLLNHIILKNQNLIFKDSDPELDLLSIKYNKMYPQKECNIIKKIDKDPDCKDDMNMEEDEYYKKSANYFDLPKFENQPDGLYLTMKVFVSRLFAPKNVVVKILHKRLIRVMAQNSTDTRSEESTECGSVTNVKMVKDFYLLKNIERLTLKAVCNKNGILKISAKVQQN